MGIDTMLEVQEAEMLIFTTHAWGNRKKADIKKIQSDADKGFLSVSKKLIDSDAYKAILSYQNAVYNWINNNSVPSFYLKGTYLFSRRMVPEVNQYISDANEALKGLVEALVVEYEEKINEARIQLADQWNPSDYPSVNQLRYSFGFEKRWVQFNVPTTLPKEIFIEEREAAEARWKEAAETIGLCLRKAFVEVIKHANEMLVVDANGKTRKFKNACFDSIDQFITSFKHRNLVNDEELEKLVEKARLVLVNVNDPQELKKDEEMRKVVSNNFKEIQTKLSEMIETTPSRKFNFDE